MLCLKSCSSIVPCQRNFTSLSLLPSLLQTAHHVPRSLTVLLPPHTRAKSRGLSFAEAGALDWESRHLMSDPAVSCLGCAILLEPLPSLVLPNSTPSSRGSHRPWFMLKGGCWVTQWRAHILGREIRSKSHMALISPVIFNLLLSLNLLICKMGISQVMPWKALVRNEIMPW